LQDERSFAQLRDAIRREDSEEARKQQVLTMLKDCRDGVRRLDTDKLVMLEKIVKNTVDFIVQSAPVRPVQMDMQHLQLLGDDSPSPPRREEDDTNKRRRVDM
jgi:hypothetical protein